MFAPPPPPQLSVAEVKKRLAEKQADGAPLSPTTSNRSDSASLKRSMSKASEKSSKTSLSSLSLKRSGRLNVLSRQRNAAKSAKALASAASSESATTSASAPVPTTTTTAIVGDPGPPPPPPPPGVSPVAPPSTPPPSTPPPPIPPNRESSNESTQRKLKLPVFEEPRQAPRPPRRPPRPPSEVFLPSLIRSPSKRGKGPLTSKPERAEVLPPLPPPLPPPPIPEKSPRRQASVTQHPESLRPHPLFFDLPASSSSAGPSSENAAAATTDPMHRVSPSKLSRHPQAESAGMESEARRDSGSSSISSEASASMRERVGMVRSVTAPPGPLVRQSGESESSSPASGIGLLARSGGSSRSLPGRAKHTKKSSITSSRSLDSSLAKVAAENARRRASPSNGDESRRDKKKNRLSGGVAKPSKTEQTQTQGKRKRKGETMSMLLDTGFFPIEEIIYGSEKKERRPTSRDYRINLPPRLSFLNGSLPTTPGSNPLTPTEFTPNSLSPRTPTSLRMGGGWNRKSGASKRSPLSQIPENDSKANSGGIEEESGEISPSALEPIPEDATTDENSPRGSVVSTPAGTQIHLRGGSVVTVTPPELTAWKPTVYIQGPIKLPKPSIMPKKNSVASLEAFQEAIDKVYQHALHVPRRRSDDKVVDDICDFFDEYGFDWISYEGDRFITDWMDMDEDQEMEGDAEPERFSTPPPEQPAASPVEVSIAKEMVENSLPGMNKLGSMPDVVVPPVENAETLRAKGIARLSRSSAGSNPLEGLGHRKDSLTLSGRTSWSGSKRGSIIKQEVSSNGLALSPAPEESMLEAVLRASHEGSRKNSASVSGSGSGSIRNSGVAQSAAGESAGSHGAQGFDWDDDEVEEIDAGSNWTASMGMSRKGKTRNPVSKVRRLVATASTML